MRGKYVFALNLAELDRIMNNSVFSLLKRHFLAKLAEISGGDIEERGYVLQREHLYNLRTAIE